MPALTFAVPILPGKTDMGKQAVAEMMSPRKNVSMSALALAIAGGGALKEGKTTALMSPEEGLETQVISQRVR